MKKAIIFIVSLIIAGLLMISCGSTQECPAYGQAQTVNNTEIGVA